MTDRDALYAAICASPEEDTPRLAFADFLDEQGGKENAARAAYIRAAIRYAREEPWSKPWRGLRDAVQKVEGRYRDLALKKRLDWVAHLAGRVRAWDFERGFVGHLTVFAKRFVAEGDRYFRDDPISSIKFVKLNSKMGSVPVAELFASPHLARAAKLNFDGSGLADKDLTQLANSKHVAGVRSLALGFENPFGKAALPNLLKGMPNLSELNCMWNTAFTDAHANALANSPDLARVTALNLNTVAITALGVEAIVSGKSAGALTELDIGLVDIDGYFDDAPRPRVTVRATRKDGVAVAGAVAASKSLGRLRKLVLAGRKIGNDGLTLLAQSKALPALRELQLKGNDIGPDGVKALADSPLGKQLLYLGLDSNKKLHGSVEALPAMFPNAEVEVPLYFDD